MTNIIKKMRNIAKARSLRKRAEAYERQYLWYQRKWLASGYTDQEAAANAADYGKEAHKLRVLADGWLHGDWD